MLGAQLLPKTRETWDLQGLVSAASFMNSSQPAGHLRAITAWGICSPPRGGKRKDVSHLIWLFGSDHHCLRCDAGNPRDGWRFYPVRRGHWDIRARSFCIAHHLPLGASGRHFCTPRITYPIRSCPLHHLNPTGTGATSWPPPLHL